MVRLLAAVSSLLCATLAVAQLSITNPSAEKWWVASSQNVLEWTCSTSPQTEFTVLITNSDKSKYPSPLAFIAIQPNFQCSIVITQDQANQPAGTGWQILFANPMNNTDVYATSDSFEIKPLGSSYPSQVTPTGGVNGGGANGTASGGTSTPTNKPSSAVSVRNVGLGGVAVAAMGVAAMLV